MSDLVVLMSPLSSLWLAVRSAFWVVALPGLVAGYVPWMYLGLREGRHVDARSPADLAGVVLLAIGVAIALASIVAFAREGRGTLSPVDPPTTLVVRGLYRYVRNPMYVGVALALIGESLLSASLPLLTYFGAWFLLVNVFVMFHEEPHLRRTFGASYADYVAHVGRWVPRLRPHEPTSR